MAPFAPHMVEEMWELTGFAAASGKMAMQNDWPVYDESKTVDATVEMAVQINGKLRATVTVPVNSEKDAVIAAAMLDTRVSSMVEGKTVVKEILVPNKILNLVIR